MDIMELGAIGELVGGAAVLVTLIYLAIQVRQGNFVERAESDRSAARDYNSVLLGLSDPGLGDAVRNAIADFDALPKEKQLQANAWLAAMFLQGQTLFLLDRRGRRTREGVNVRTFASFLRSPGVAQWWTWTKELFDPEFVSHIEAIAAGPDPPRPIQEILPWFTTDGTEQPG